MSEDQSVFKKLKSHWGFAVFCLVSLLGLIRLLRQAFPAHYILFTRAADLLWMGQNPYGSDLDTGIGYWFYSPTCGLLFFKWFSWFPQKLGLLIYMGISWAIFLWGIRSFLKVSQDRFGYSLRGMGENLFWIVLSPHILLSILASKIEIVMVGALLLSTSWILSKKRTLGAAVLISFILNWKFQPLPIVGLILLSLFLTKSREVWRLGGGVLVGVAFWFAFPFLVISKDSLIQMHQVWSSTLSDFVQVAWKDFDNVYFALGIGAHLPLSYSFAQTSALGFGVLFALSLIVFFYRWKEAIQPHQMRFLLILFSLGLGSLFAVLFSPLSQNNSFILLTPSWLMLIFLSFNAFSQNGKRYFAGLGVFWFLILALSYSDLIPQELRTLLRSLKLKPASNFLVAMSFAAFCWFSFGSIPILDRTSP